MNREDILAQARRHHNGILLSATMCDEIVRRLKAGESSADVGHALGVGRKTMGRYEQISRMRCLI